MSRRVRTGVVIVGVGVLLTLLTIGYVRQAVRQAPRFYAAALEIDPQLLTHASREMESRVAALYSDAIQEPTWQAAFSETEVNGWLTVALGERYSEILPESITAPRVAFDEAQCQIGFQFQGQGYQAAISVQVSVFVADTDELAICIQSANMGMLPLPLAKIVDPLTKWAQEQKIALRWTKHKGSPVALFPLQEILSTDSERRQLKAIELHPDELVLAGKTLQAKSVLEEKQPILAENQPVLAEKSKNTITR